ncbi:MAG: hypothetical protein VB118_06810 [Oscillospiraceae bacterium]|nr:hypothetical protein [Oscillospiraceae bacterium]
MSLYITLGRVRISVFFLAAFFILYILNPGVYILIMLASAAAHEAGHFVAAAFAGRRIGAFEIKPFGAQITLDGRLSGYNSDIWIAVSGSVANIFAGATAYLFYKMHPSDDLFFLVLANAALAFVNLLPVNGFDGGAALYAAIASKTDCFLAQKICDYVSVAFSGVILCAAVFACVRFGFNLSLVLIASAIVFEAAYGFKSRENRLFSKKPL